jgi:hypothetical protein
MMNKHSELEALELSALQEAANKIDMQQQEDEDEQMQSASLGEKPSETSL